MCLPAAGLAGAAYGLQGASTALGLVTAHDQYKRQLGAAEDVEQAANANSIRQYQSILSRQTQEQAKAAQAIGESNRSARLASGTGAVASAEAGVAGASVAAAQGEFSRAALEFESTTIRNQAFLRANFQNQMEGVRAEQEATVQNAYNQVTPPNYLGILLQGVGSALEIRGDQLKRKPIG